MRFQRSNATVFSPKMPKWISFTQWLWPFEGHLPDLTLRASSGGSTASSARTQVPRQFGAAMRCKIPATPAELPRATSRRALMPQPWPAVSGARAHALLCAHRCDLLRTRVGRNATCRCNIIIVMTKKLLNTCTYTCCILDCRPFHTRTQVQQTLGNQTSERPKKLGSLSPEELLTVEVLCRKQSTAPWMAATLPLPSQAKTSTASCRTWSSMSWREEHLPMLPQHAGSSPQAFVCARTPL